MPYLGFDVCGPPSAAALVADMHASGARLVGLYVYNSSAPSCVVSASYIAQVEQAYGAPCVMPIVTIASGDAPSGATIVSAIQARISGLRKVAHDLETYAEPPNSVIQGVINAEHAAGYHSGIYGFSSTEVQYPDAWDFYWGVIDYSQPFGYLPGQDSLFQYRGTTQMGNGAYDLNTVADSFSVMVSTPAPPMHAISSSDS